MAFADPTAFGDPTYQIVLGTTADPLERVILNFQPGGANAPHRNEPLVQKVIDLLNADPELTFIEASKIVMTTAYGAPTE